jgi:hypothetical protein
MPLFRADKLASLQTAVRAFDLLVVVLWILTAVLVLLTIWLAAARLRMVIYLGIGVVVTFLAARLIVLAVQNTIVSSISESTGLASIKDTVQVFVRDLFGLVWILVIGAVVVTLVAYFATRPRWVSTAATAVSGAAGQAGASGSAAFSDGVGAWARGHRPELRMAGIGVVAFVIIWMAVGIEVAVLAGALMAAWFILIGRGDDEAPAGEVVPGTGTPA